ncbi:MAG TPA: carboxypeptidase regulatory-like domain-containing protein [Nitrospira sp.]|nr:carboxypeptidase regulatory-like domain-containing protein [Nitrospira sp.]
MSSISDESCEPSKKIRVEIVTSNDPNEKVGSHGVGTERWLADEEPLRYSIFFENKPTASAPAQDVVVTDQLDHASLDLTTLSLGPISFADKVVAPPAGLPLSVTGQFNADVDLRPANNLIVRINATLNQNTNVLTWRFTSIDPATGQPPEDPLAGFLPPGAGGSVFFTVMPKKGLPTGTNIRNKATIVFDVNPPLDTPEWSNALDGTKPTSRVLPLATIQNSCTFNVRWEGTDVGSGVRDFTVYVSDNGGPLTPWLTQTTATQAAFTGADGHTYSFFSVARDLTANSEDGKTVAEATTRVVSNADISLALTAPPGSIGIGSNITYTLAVSNSGTDAAAPITVTDNLPGDLTFVSCEATGGGVCGGSGNNRTVTYQSLGNGATATITLVATVSSVPDGNTIINVASVSSPTVDPNPANNSATLTTVVQSFGITGRVQDTNGHALSGVALTLGGSRTGAATSDAAGNYSFPGLPAGGNYTVTPAKPRYIFSPTSRNFTGLDSNQTAHFIATVVPGVPVLISEESSTRAIALGSPVWLRDPFQLNSPVPWGVDQRTRVMLFAMNFDLIPGESISVVTVDAEDATHRIYPLTVEYVGNVPGFEWLRCVIVRLNDEMGNVGDVLVRVNVRGVPSNRVRLGVGHTGGGPPDDPGSVPTPGRGFARRDGEDVDDREDVVEGSLTDDEYRAR